MRERILARAAIAGFAVGVIGLAVVATTSDDDSPSRLPPIALGGATGAEDRAAALWSPAGAIEYRVRGNLPDLPGRARAWTLGRDEDRARIETLARALGLDGTVRAGADGWTVSAGGRSLRVERQPGLPWYFGPDGGDDAGCVVPAAPPGQPPAPDTPVTSDGCESSGVGGDGAVVRSAASSGSAPATDTATTTVCTPPPCPPGSASCRAVTCDPPETIPDPERPPDLPTQEQAEATARALLAKAGVDLDGARVRVDDGFSQWRVEVDPQVGGLPTFGLSSGVSVGPKGAIEGANGWLAEPGPGDEYPLVTAAAGFERLKQSPSGIGPQPLIARAPACEGCETQPSPVRTITGVRVGLAFAPLLEPDDAGGALLVPVFLFDIDEGGTVPVLAVADEFLPKPHPTPEPGPAATEPGPAATEPAPATEPELPTTSPSPLFPPRDPAASESVDPAPR